MKTFWLSTHEFQGNRFGQLCRELGARTPEDRWPLFGHLVEWHATWSRLIATDSGVWFEESLATIGSWAGVSGGEAAVWGGALRKAGYVSTLLETYPEPLGARRHGWVARSFDGGAMLDDTIARLQKRPDSELLTLYVLNREVRLKFARRLELNAEKLEREGIIPIGWLTDDGDAPSIQRRERASASMGASVAPSVQSSAGTRVEPKRFGDAGPSPQREQQQVTARHTGKPKSDEMLSTVRQYRYQDPMRALKAMDDSPQAMQCWKRAISSDRDAVCTILANMTETDRAWANLRIPASVAMEQIRRPGLLD